MYSRDVFNDSYLRAHNPNDPDTFPSMISLLLIHVSSLYVGIYMNVIFVHTTITFLFIWHGLFFILAITIYKLLQVSIVSFGAI
jgi:hypothetical protein